MRVAYASKLFLESAKRPHHHIIVVLLPDIPSQRITAPVKINLAIGSIFRPFVIRL